MGKQSTKTSRASASLGMPKSSLLHRRQVLSGLGGLTIGSLLGGIGARSHRPSHAWAQSAQSTPRFLIVIACAGGASILDSALAQRESELGSLALNAFPDADVRTPTDSPIRAVRTRIDGLGSIPYQNQFDQFDFVQRHHQQMSVMTYSGTSVNHLIAQKRSLTGNDAWGGRTLQEAVATQYGANFTLPNVNMASGGYVEPSHDPTLPSFAVGELISTPLLWPLGLHGTKGVSDERVPASSIISKARRWRNDHLDQESTFVNTFKEDARLTRWLKNRREIQPQLEENDLISALNFLPDTPLSPLGDFGLSDSAEGAKVRQIFPEWLTDPLEAQAALAYLLITQGVSVTVTIGPNFNPLVLQDSEQLVDSPPLAFDFSHTDHRATQALMWSRLYSVVDRLITLLSDTELSGGTSYWDRSLIYFASEFGRTRNRPNGASQFSSGHHLNNGALMISPLIRGDRIFGGVDTQTALTYGFDPITGAPEPGRVMSEDELFSALLEILEVDTSGSGLPAVPALKRA